MNCSISCDMLGPHTVTISKRHQLRTLEVPRYFTLTFDVRSLGRPSAGSTDKYNFMALQDSGTYVFALFTGLSPAGEEVLVVLYRGQLGVGPALPVLCFSAWCPVTVTFLSEEFTVTILGESTTFLTADFGGDLGSARFLQVFASSADSVSSGGFIRSLHVTGAISLHCVI